MADRGNETALVMTETVVLRGLAVAFLVLAVLAAWHLSGGNAGRAAGILEFWVALGVAASLLIISFLRASVRIGSMVAATIFAVGFFTIESYLSRIEIMMPEVAKARRLGVTFDDRLLKDAVLQRRARGEAVTFAMFPADYLFGFGDAVILSNPPNSKIVLCNELGSFESIASDEYGFNNPPGVWNAASIDVLLLGDSYFEGYCVPAEHRLAETVRRRYPSTVNLGRGGLGPLGALAMMREYAPALRPKVIVWSYYDNDWADMQAELQAPTLVRYLRDRDFTQNLHARREQVNQIVHDFTERRVERLEATQHLPFKGTRQFMNHQLPRLLKQQDLRAGITGGDDATRLHEQFGAVMQEAQRVAAQLGAVLIFAHLRDFRYSPPPSAEGVTEIVASLGIKAIDMADEVHRHFADPREIHRLTRHAPLDAAGNLVGHYNPQGHRIAGEFIAAAIAAQRDGLNERDSEAADEPPQ